MKSVIVARALCASLLVALPLGACATARMQLPTPLESAAPLTVEGRQGWRIKERLRFGSFETVDVDRSWTKGSDLRILVYERNKRRQHFTFTLADGGTAIWRVDCSARLRVRGVEVRGVEIVAEDRSEVDCALAPAPDAGGDTWRLSLIEQREQPLEGILAGEGRTLVVTGTNRIQGGIVPIEGASGYVFRDGEAVLGAVEIVNDGRVWLNASQQDGLLAAASAALLLVEDLRAHLSD